MAEEKVKKSFSDTRAYPIIFMIIITILFIGILATFYQLTLDRVQNYQQTQMQNKILNLFDLPLDNVKRDFQKYITKLELDEIIYYKAQKDSLLLGYCFPISGNGLWGKIDAFIALSQDLKILKKLEIVDQNETPGLGGRITENWFKIQFNDKIIINDNLVRKFQLISEGNVAKNQEIQQITGATASSKAVVDMIYNSVKEIKKIDQKL